MSFPGASKLKSLTKTKMLIIGLWLIGASTTYHYLYSVQFDKKVVIQNLINLFNSPWGVFIFVFIFAIRFLVAAPATLLIITAGFVYGFEKGLAIVLVSATLSDTLNYHLGKFLFNLESLVKKEHGIIKKILNHPFETVLLGRLAFFPHDALSFISGAVGINFWKYILATALGAIPPMIAVVSFGAGIESIGDFERFELNYSYLLTGVVVLGLSIVAGQMLSKHRNQRLGVKQVK